MYVNRVILLCLPYITSVIYANALSLSLSPPTETSMVKGSLSSHQGWVVCVKWSPTDAHQLLSGSYDSTLRLWDIRSPKEPLFTITAHEGKVLCCDWSIPSVSGLIMKLHEADWTIIDCCLFCRCWSAAERTTS